MTTVNTGRRSGLGVEAEARQLEVVAVSGSLRRDSLNTRLLHQAQRLAPAGMRVRLFTGLHEIPHFNEDLESSAPVAAQKFRERVSASHGLLIATPEYNASIPGVLKNALDWLSRPGVDGTQPLAGKPIAIMGASKGPFGAIRSQLALRQVLQKTGASVVAQPEVAVPFGDQTLAEGHAPDSLVGTLLAQLLTELSVLIERSQVSAS
jgi:chromate reductase, NAD(P)H dehydrogenase (quinone)